MVQGTFTIRKKNDQNIAGHIFLPDQEGRYPVVIFSHGFGGNCIALMEHGPAVAEAGFGAVFFDFCGGGIGIESDGIMAEMTVQSEMEDLKTVTEEIRSKAWADPENLFYTGESMGGMVSALVAAEKPGWVKALGLWYPAFVVPDDARKRCESGVHSVFGLELNPRFDELAMAIDVYHTIGAYKGPVKILHGDRDDMVPISYSERAVQVYENAQLEVFRGAEHVFEGKDSDLAIDKTLEFFRAQM